MEGEFGLRPRVEHYLRGGPAGPGGGAAGGPTGGGRDAGGARPGRAGRPGRRQPHARGSRAAGPRS
ncbi:unnamed protein product [Spirodela intermedia]|uniref:Uncharacterized protein n=1 Tax=Spirodela intermedia TaxID=51605 RepID=A0A7I8L7G8_SPIIN|nr:unnamed protein product [Spirodela intermedia]